MAKVSVKFTVYFDDPFWVGIFERNINSKLSVCKIVFGAEPSDGKLFEFILANYNKLIFSPEIITEKNVKEKVNPKRAQKNAKNDLKNVGVGTKSQQALKLQQEQNKTIRKVKSKEQRELEKEKVYFIKQEKRKEKHKGR